MDCPGPSPANWALFTSKSGTCFSRKCSLPGSDYCLPAATYFQLAEYSAISDLPDREFAALLTREHGVAAIPVSVFYRESPPQSIVRFCFAKEDSTLEQAGGGETDRPVAGFKRNRWYRVSSDRISLSPAASTAAQCRAPSSVSTRS